MVRPVTLAVRKQARQRRAIATVEAIIEAAAYILERDGPGRFTTNRVAEKAGVNVSSLYQYFPNKEALLFCLVGQTWERQLAKLAPILTRPSSDHGLKLRHFLREFFLIEAAEVDLRSALRAASVDLKETAEYRALIATGAELIATFLGEAIGARAASDLAFHVRFIVLLTTSFAERSTDERTPASELVRQADLITDMLVAHYSID